MRILVEPISYSFIAVPLQFIEGHAASVAIPCGSFRPLNEEFLVDAFPIVLHPKKRQKI